MTEVFMSVQELENNTFPYNLILTYKKYNMKKPISLSLFLVILVVGNAKSQVIFNYDDAGNQIYRGTASGTGRMASSTESTSTPTLADQVANKIQAAPVPVKTSLNVIWEKDIKDYIVKIDLLAYNSFQIMETVDVKSKMGNSYTFDMNKYSYGVYYLKFYLSDGSVYTRTITKN